jgi:hypothetical protein
VPALLDSVMCRLSSAAVGATSPRSAPISLRLRRLQSRTSLDICQPPTHCLPSPPFGSVEQPGP